MRLPEGRLSRAVLIGSSSYSDARLTQLGPVTATANALHALLTDSTFGILPPENCALLADEGDLRLVGSTLRSAAREPEFNALEFDKLRSAVLTSPARTNVALILDGEPYTAFTGRMIQLLTEGSPEGGELLTVDEIYRLLHRRMTAEGLPLPQKHGTLNADELALSRNRAFVGTAAPRLRTESEEASARGRNGECGRTSWLRWTRI